MTVLTQPAATTVADVLERAADHIERVGWTQGALYDHTQADTRTPLSQCRVDAAGGIYTAVYGRPRAGIFQHHQQMTIAWAAERALTHHIGLALVAREQSHREDEWLDRIAGARTPDDDIPTHREHP